MKTSFVKGRGYNIITIKSEDDKTIHLSVMTHFVPEL